MAIVPAAPESASLPNPQREARFWNVPGGRDARLLVAARIAVSSQRALAGVITPIYLSRIGFSAIKLGTLFAAVAAAAALMSLAIGWSADRVGRKPFLVIIPGLMAVAAVVFALTQQTALLFIAAAAGSFGRGSGAGASAVGPYQPAEQALLAGLVPEGERNRLFGTLASASALGALVGGLLATLSPGGHGHVGTGTYRAAFLIAALLAVVAALLAVPVHDSVRHERRTNPKPAVRAPLSGRSRWLLVRLWATNTSNGMATGLFGPFVTYWFYTRFDASAAKIGVLFAIVNVVTVVTNYGAAPLARGLGTVRAVVLMRTGQAALLIPMAVAPTFVAAGAIYLVRMAVQRAGMPLRQSFVMGAAPSNERARVAAYSELPSQAIAAAAPTLTGYLFEEVSLALPFELAGLFQLCNAGLFWRFFGRNQAPAPEPVAKESLRG